MSDIIEKIYAAPLELSAWAEVVDAVAARVCGAGGGQFHIFDLARRQILYSCMPSWISRTAELEYNEHHAPVDPRRYLIDRSPPGAWIYDQEHFDDRYVCRSEIFQFLIRHNIRYAALTHLHCREQTSVGFGIMRAPDQRAFGPDARETLTRLSPHLVRAAKLTLAFADLRERASLGAKGLDSLADAVLVIDARGMIKVQNDAAKALFRDGRAIAETGGRLRCIDASSHARLAKATRAAVESGTGAALDIRDANGVRVLACRLVLLPPSGPLAEAGGQRRILLVLRKTEVSAGSLRDLSALFGLTDAEQRVAARVAAGATPGEIAASMDLSIATVRSHLSRLLSKTNTRRQSELVAVLRARGQVADG